MLYKHTLFVQSGKKDEHNLDHIKNSKIEESVKRYKRGECLS